MFEDEPQVVVPGAASITLDPVIRAPEEPGFGDAEAMAEYDRNKKEETMCESLGRTTMQITPEGGGKFTTLTFVVPRTAEEKAQLKADIELALRYGQKYGKKE